jgi:phosphatidylethanolamine/phosphatidyl-N-methylethanolamine N-methyltransferase
MLTFLGQAAARFRETGAIAPSGRGLSKAMARMVGTLEPGAVIIELGPGTGAFSRELTRQYPDHPVVAVEFNQVFARNLRRELPAIQVVEGCASQLPAHLERLGIEPSRVGAVVSGLPLLSLPKDLAASIIDAIAAILPEGRAYVQFTYSERAWRNFDLSRFNREKTRKVWLNLPPAVVMPFTRAG